MRSRHHAISSSGSIVWPGREHDERVADLAHALVGHADDRDLAHRRVVADHVLDLGGIRVEAADDEHVLLAIGDAEVAALVEHADVAGVVAGGEQSGYGMLSVREQLWMFSQFYGLRVREGRRRVEELIVAVGLEDQRQQRIGSCPPASARR